MNVNHLNMKNMFNNTENNVASTKQDYNEATSRDGQDTLGGKLRR